MATGLSIATDALAELNIFTSIDTAPSVDTTYVIGKANRILSQWRAIGVAQHSEVFSTFTLTANLQPHLIGPGGSTSFTSAVRPTKIDGANIIVGSGVTAVRWPLNIRDRNWWLDVDYPGYKSTVQSDLYYDPTETTGSIYLWPVPSAAATLELMMRRPLADIVSATTFTMPDGYLEALILTTAEQCIGPFPAPDPPRLSRLIKAAAAARAVIFNNNSVIPKLETCDAGIPG